jgi:hypothetical protein
MIETSQFTKQSLYVIRDQEKKLFLRKSIAPFFSELFNDALNDIECTVKNFRTTSNRTIIPIKLLNPDENQFL